MSLKRAILDETSTAAEKIAKTSFATADACKKAVIIIRKRRE